MNENLNLVDILRDCPRGTKLYSSVYGEVEFLRIGTQKNYPIECEATKDKTSCGFTKDGREICRYVGGECVLFPSKENRDWSKFKVESEMVDGEIYYTKIGFVEWIFIYKRTYMFKTSHYVAVLNNYLMEFNNICTTHNEDIKVLRKATEEEKRLFFESIEKNGRKWDADKKELVRIGEKFDVSTLQPFDKVLTRDWNDSIWRCNIYESFKECQCYPFITISGVCNQCVPYNEETKHLVGTTKLPPEKYINWEE